MEQPLMHELAAGYALDALEPDQARAYEDHLAGCESCRDELADFAEVTGALAHAAPAAEPPAELRRRILDAAETEQRGQRPSRPGWAVPLAALAAVACCAAVAIGIWAATLDSGRARLSALPLRGASGAVVVAADRSAVLVLSGLPRAPAGKTYEIWIMRAGKTARPAGLFRATGAAIRVNLNRHLPSGSFVSVTLEPAGGAAAPSGPPIVRSATA